MKTKDYISFESLTELVNAHRNGELVGFKGQVSFYARVITKKMHGTFYSFNVAEGNSFAMCHDLTNNLMNYNQCKLNKIAYIKGRLTSNNPTQPFNVEVFTVGATGRSNL